MKKFNFIKIFAIIPFLLLIGLFTFPGFTLAAEGETMQMQVGIPGTKFEGEATITPDTETLGEFVRAIYNYSIGIVGILAAVVIMIAGVIWLTAGGNTNKVETAKTWMGGALTGLILVLTSYMLLYQINPELVEFDPPSVDKMFESKRKGCCEDITKTTKTMSSGAIMSEEKCKKLGGTFYLNKEWNDEAGECQESQKTCCVYSTSCMKNISKKDCKDPKTNGQRGIFKNEKCKKVWSCTDKTIK